MLNSKVKPDSEAGIACVGSNKEVELKLTNVVYTPQITCKEGQRERGKDF